MAVFPYIKGKMVNMKKLKRKKKLKILLSVISITLVAVIGFFIYSTYQADKMVELLSGLSFSETIEYTTKDKDGAFISVGIVQDGKVDFTVYGKDGSVVSPEEQYDYEVGSITKTFNAMLLANALDEKKINLSDSIDKHLDLPEQDYYPTIERLVTHTAGYREYYFESQMIFNFFKGRNSFYGISNEQILSKAGKIKLKDEDYPFRYSNFGQAVLGLVLEKVYGDSYTNIMNDYIQDSLALNSTKVSDGNGNLSDYWDWKQNDGYVPAGAIVSNIEDMLKFLQMQMTENPKYLAATHGKLKDNFITADINDKLNIHVDGMGICWMIDETNNIIWHNGATGNYNSYIGFDKANQTGVVILSNLPPDYKIPATIMGVKLLSELKN